MVSWKLWLIDCEVYGFDVVVSIVKLLAIVVLVLDEELEVVMINDDLGDSYNVFNTAAP